MTEIFQPFPKLARLSRGCVVTEKLDGTNAQVYIVDTQTLEGVVVYHAASRASFNKTFDDRHKESIAA